MLQSEESWDRLAHTVTASDLSCISVLFDCWRLVLKAVDLVAPMVLLQLGQCSAGHEPYEPYFAWLKFGISNGLEKNSNSTQFML